MRPPVHEARAANEIKERFGIIGQFADPLPQFDVIGCAAKNHAVSFIHELLGQLGKMAGRPSFGLPPRARSKDNVRRPLNQA